MIFSFLYISAKEYWDLHDDKNLRERIYRAADLSEACTKMAKFISRKVESGRVIWLDEEVLFKGNTHFIPTDHEIRNFI